MRLANLRRILTGRRIRKASLRAVMKEGIRVVFPIV